MTLHAFYSAGGYARENTRHIQASAGGGEIAFIDDDPALHGTLVNGMRVLSYAECRSLPDAKINVAFAGPALRRRVFEKCARDGFSFFSVFAATCIIGDDVEIGEGAIFSDYSIVTANARIGIGFHCNIYSYVAHDCIVGDFVTLAPRVSLNGRIKVEDEVYIGSGATFLPGKPEKFLTIGRGAVIGAGAVVTKDVEAGSVVVGAPARPLRGGA